MLGDCALVGGEGIEFSAKIDDVVCVKRIVEWTDGGHGRSRSSSSVGGAGGGHGHGRLWSVAVVLYCVREDATFTSRQFHLLTFGWRESKRFGGR